MQHFRSLQDVPDPLKLVQLAEELKANPAEYNNIYAGKTIGLFFMNASLRTRLSTQKAAENLGLKVMVVNLNQEGWQLEYEHGTIMNGTKPEHVIEAAAVIGEYCDLIGLRSFPTLTNREEDYAEVIINSFAKYSGKPVISLESATLHPLQSLADWQTIREVWAKNPASKNRKPKVVLTWAPHPRALPQCVPNSFSQWMGQAMDVDLHIAHPLGYELNSDYTKKATHITNNQLEAFEGADFIYAKNWSSYQEYGKILSEDPSWMVSNKQMLLTNNAKFMHCLPVRRNVVVADEVLDSDQSIVIRQASNRVWSAQAVIKSLLDANNS